MLNYVAGYLITYLIFESQSYWRETKGFNATRLPDRRSRCPTRPSGRRGRSTSRAAIVIPLGLLLGLAGRRRALGALQADAVRVRGAGAGRLGARGAVRRRAHAPQDPRRDGDLGRDRRPRRREPGRRLRARARRRPERPPEARLRLHGHRRRRARALQPVRGLPRRVPDRRARERRQHAPGRRLPGRPRRRDPGDHPLLRARRRGARPLPPPVRARARRRPAPAAEVETA